MRSQVLSALSSYSSGHNNPYDELLQNPNVRTAHRCQRANREFVLVRGGEFLTTPKACAQKVITKNNNFIAFVLVLGELTATKLCNFFLF